MPRKTTRRTRSARKTTRRAAARPRARAADAEAPQVLIDAVINVLHRTSPFPPAEITPCLDLRQALGLTDEVKQALSHPFQDLARQHNPSARISDDEAGRLEIVEDALVLVAAKARFTFTRDC